MRFTLTIPVIFALGAVAAPVDDCTSLKSLGVLNGAKVFCAAKFPSTDASAVVDKPKSNAKRFQQDDDRVVRILSSMPESRQKAFCACYPAVATTETKVVAPLASAVSSAVASATASPVSAAKAAVSSVAASVSL